MTSHPITDFITVRLAEDEAAALAAVEPDRPGMHWEWVDPDDDTAAAPEDGYLISASLRTVETFPTGGAEGWSLPGFIIHTAEEVPEGAAVHITRNSPARVLREVAAKRAILEHESTVTLHEWKPDCGGDWVLSGPGFFANYWPDNTVAASIGEDDGPRLADSGIVPKESRAACQVFAENWIRNHLPERSPVLRALAAVYSDHEAYRPEWRP